MSSPSTVVRPRLQRPSRRLMWVPKANPVMPSFSTRHWLKAHGKSAKILLLFVGKRQYSQRLRTQQLGHESSVLASFGTAYQQTPLFASQVRLCPADKRLGALAAGDHLERSFGMMAAKRRNATAKAILSSVNRQRTAVGPAVVPSVGPPVGRAVVPFSPPAKPGPIGGFSTHQSSTD